jgi:hypothetical protein
LSALSVTLSPEQLGVLATYLRSLEENFPIKELYSRMVGDEVPAKDSLAKDEVIAQAKKLYEVLRISMLDSEKAFTALLKMEPYVFDPLLAGLIEENKSEIQQETKE